MAKSRLRDVTEPALFVPVLVSVRSSFCLKLFDCFKDDLPKMAPVPPTGCVFWIKKKTAYQCTVLTSLTLSHVVISGQVSCVIGP